MSEVSASEANVNGATDNAIDTDALPDTDEASPEAITENEAGAAMESEPATEQKSNKAHLTSSVPRVARVPAGALTKGEMAQIREIFGDIDDSEIQRLYKRVTK